MSSDKDSAPARRSFFPTSYSKKESRKEKYNVTFSPYARSLKLESLDLSDKEKSHMWWQKSDYEDFARVNRIISKAMLVGGGTERWLRSKSSSSSSSSSTISSNEHTDCNNNNNSISRTTTKDKWWHKFGHSRRGLEHFVSTAEGRQRHLNVRSATRAIIEEQQRQRMFLPKGYSDVDKFRTVYLKETHWARVLARAYGDSDADAVQMNFDETRRKSREYYLKKHFDIHNHSDYSTSTNYDMHLPIFMKTIYNTISPPKHSTKKMNLDANTSSQIRFRKSQVSISGNKLQENDDDDDATISSTSSEDSSASSIAKMAAGWHGDESSSPDDMSSVLIGMGISTKPRPGISTKPRPNITVG